MDETLNVPNEDWCIKDGFIYDNARQCFVKKDHAMGLKGHLFKGVIELGYIIENKKFKE